MNFVLQILSQTLNSSSPLILAAMAGIMSERSGVVNIALEGMMLLGAFVAIPVAAAFGVPAGIAAAVVAGILLGLLHATATQKLRIGAIVSGVAINILATGITKYLALVPSIPQSADGPTVWAVPVLSRIPLLGPVFFQQSPFTYFAWFTVVAVTFFLWKTPWGLRVLAAGENPEAVKAAGINVVVLRLATLSVAGALAAIGGAQLSLGGVHNFTNDMTAGRGFMALAAVVFGRWKPSGAFVACLFFVFADALMSGLPVVMAAAARVPSEFIAMLPYLATLLALVFFSRQVHAPAATADTGD